MDSIRQLTVTDLGHEEPTLLLTNQLTRSPAKLIGRYAQRMLIENNIADGIDFFHMDALSSAVAMKVDCDLQLTLMASSLYRLLGARHRRRVPHGEIAPHLPGLRRCDRCRDHRRAHPSPLSETGTQSVSYCSRV